MALEANDHEAFLLGFLAGCCLEHKDVLEDFTADVTAEGVIKPQFQVTMMGKRLEVKVREVGEP